MPAQPRTYDDWLSLSPAEQDEVHRQWNVYYRDGLPIAHTAAARLALQSPWKVLEITVGTYHGGEYVLQLTVREEDFLSCPPFLQQVFEGFRVIWLPLRLPIPADDQCGKSLEGRWRTLDDDGEPGDYEFAVRRSDTGVAVSARCLSSGEERSITSVWWNPPYLCFSTFEPTTCRQAKHTMCLVSPNRAEGETSKADVFARVG